MNTPVKEREKKEDDDLQRTKITEHTSGADKGGEERWQNRNMFEHKRKEGLHKTNKSKDYYG